MAIFFSDYSAYLSRSATYLNPASDWTRSVWALIGQDSQTIWLLDDTLDFSAPWVWVGENVGPPQGYQQQADIGGGEIDGTVITATLNVWTYVTLRYTAGVTTLEMMINGIVVDTITLDLSAVTPRAMESLGSWLGQTGTNSLALEQEGVWQDALTDDQIALQMVSQTPLFSPVRWTSLFTFADLGTWSTTGSISQVAGPAPTGDFCTSMSCATFDPICWLRVGPHLNQDKIRVTFSRFELDMDVGQDATSGEALVYLASSNDGGVTWGDWRETSAGTTGQYQARVFWTRLGQSRDRVYRIAGCGFKRIIAAYQDVQLGTS